MHTDKIEKLFSLMKVFKVSHFKDGDCEISIPSNNIAEIEEFPVEVKTKPRVNHKVTTIPPQAAPPVESKIPHHVNEAARLLKLSDEDLVDELFPIEPFALHSSGE